MIRIVTPDSYAAYGRKLSEMRRLRYRVFKERLGWEVRSDEGEERDEFDDLGPQRIGNTSALAGLFETSPAVLEEVRAMAGIAGSVICAPYPVRRSKAA